MYLFKRNSSPFYQISYLRGGKKTKVSTGTKIKSEALKFLSEFEKNISREVLKPVISLKQFEAEYLDYIKGNKKESYIRSVKLSFRMLFDYLGNKDLAEIEKHLIEKFISKRFLQSESAAALYYRSLKAAFSKAESWGHIKLNPFYKLKSPKPKTKLPAYLTEEQFSQLLSFVKEPFLKNLFTVLFYTGIRAGEGVNLQLNDIDLINKVIYIRNRETFTTKSGKERMIPLNESAFDVLKDQFPKVYKINSFSYAFWRVDPKICLTVDYCSKKFKESVRAAGLDENLHLHSLRHSFCSNLVSAGASLYTVQTLAGHSSPNVTKIYSHIANASLVEAVNLLGRIKYNTKVSI